MRLDKARALLAFDELKVTMTVTAPAAQGQGVTAANCPTRPIKNSNAVIDNSDYPILPRAASLLSNVARKHLHTQNTSSNDKLAKLFCNTGPTLAISPSLGGETSTFQQPALSRFFTFVCCATNKPQSRVFIASGVLQICCVSGTLLSLADSTPFHDLTYVSMKCSSLE